MTQYLVSSPLHVVSMSQILIPGDKSISHRALLCALLTEGITEIQHFLPSEDCLSTLVAIEQLGAKITWLAPTRLQVTGVGFAGLTQPSAPINCGNAGTLARLLLGILAASTIRATLIGDASLSKRPMARVIVPLRAMGAVIEASQGDTLPLRVEGRQLHGITYTLPVASAQIKSCLLFAALNASGTMQVIESTPTRNHTELMLPHMGVQVQANSGMITLCGPQSLTPALLSIPGDLSSAAFGMALVAAKPGARCFFRHVGVNPTRIGFLTCLQEMGASVRLLNHRVGLSEPIADVEIIGAPLTGIVVPKVRVPSMIDEFPILFVLAAIASGQTTITGVTELRHKESDRIAVMQAGLQVLGGHCEVTQAGVTIQGGQLLGGQVSSAGDHRVAMAFAVAGALATAPVAVLGSESIATSYPDFTHQMRALGVELKDAVYAK